MAGEYLQPTQNASPKSDRLLGGRHDVRPTRQFPIHYALINSNPTNPDGYNWDAPDLPLQRFLAMSRIVHPSSIGLEFCARIVEIDHGWDIIPGPSFPHAYSDNPRSFPRLIEWKETAALFEKWTGLRGSNAPATKSIQRIANALWWREKAAIERQPPARWPALISSIEALIAVRNLKKKQIKSTANFKRGIALLASLCGVTYSVDSADQAYNIRSSFSHGQPFPERSFLKYVEKSGSPGVTIDDEIAHETHSHLYQETEGVLDSALRRLISDDAARSIFDDDNSIAQLL